jgi:hypothetical protein
VTYGSFWFARTQPARLFKLESEVHYIGRGGPCPLRRHTRCKLYPHCQRSRSAWMCRSTIFYKSPTTPRWRGQNATLKPRFLCPRRSSRSTQLLCANSMPLISPRTKPCSGPASGTGLRIAHKRGIVHRDIKPANVMATDRQVIRQPVRYLD